MNKIHTYIFVALLFLGACGKENNPEPIEGAFFGKVIDDSNNAEQIILDEYNGIPQSKKTLIKGDEFTSDLGNFLITTDSRWYLVVENGSFYIEYREDNDNDNAGVASNSLEDSFSFNTSIDFEMETSIQFETDKLPFSTQFIWQQDADMDAGTPQYFDRVIFEPNSNCRFQKRLGNTILVEENLNEPFDENLISQTDYNKLTVRKVANEYYIFINEKFLKKNPFDGYAIDRFYFAVLGLGAIKVDYLRVYELDLE